MDIIHQDVDLEWALDEPIAVLDALTAEGRSEDADEAFANYMVKLTVSNQPLVVNW